MFQNFSIFLLFYDFYHIISYFLFNFESNRIFGFNFWHFIGCCWNNFENSQKEWRWSHIGLLDWTRRNWNRKYHYENVFQVKFYTNFLFFPLFPSVSPSVSICLSICLCACLYVCLCVCLRVCLFVCVSVCLCICLSDCLSACVCLSVFLSFFFFFFFSRLVSCWGMLCKMKIQRHFRLGTFWFYRCMPHSHNKHNLECFKKHTYCRMKSTEGEKLIIYLSFILIIRIATISFFL